MTKNFCFTLAALLIAVGASAQFVIPKVGFVVNYNTESINGYNAKAGIGILAGLGYSTKLSNRLLFQPEVYYIQKSYTLDFSDSRVTSGNNPTTTTLTSKSEYHIGYIEIPLLLKWKFMQEKMFIVLGPYISVGLGGNYKYDQTNQYGDTTPTRIAGSGYVQFGTAPSGNIKDAYFKHRVDVGLQPGIGMIVMKKFTVEVRAILGTVSLQNGRDSRNESVSVSASYPINLKRVDE